jgi:hypothetical protein
VIDILIDVHQYQRIGEAESKAARAREASERVQRDLDDLRRRADALTLVCHALWEILQEHAGLADEEILRKVEAIDLRDGRADGRITPKLVDCPKCARRTKSTRPVCLYCGTALPAETILGTPLHKPRG